MPRRSSYVYAPPGARHALVRGPLGMRLRDMGFRSLWCNVQRGWLVRSERVTDVLTAAEVAGEPVEFSQRPAPPPRPRTGVGA